ncbi:MAG: aspartyl-phosphate phosphatase Spo0E family protein [Bacillota bacterium]
MGNKDQIEIARTILYNAININMRKEIILKISQKIDKYIVEYFNKKGNQSNV